MGNHWLYQERFLILDGALGTMLQRAGFGAGTSPEEALFSAPEKVTDIHRSYVDAGADIICCNSFGANAKKLAGSGHTVAEVVYTAVACAKKAVAGTASKVALDVGPLGEMLEPVGALSFEDAYALFAEAMTAGKNAGADLVFLETMADLYEVKAALLACKENTDLPVIASMTFDEGGRTFSGVPVEAMAAGLNGLGADALCINCSLGPQSLLPLAERLSKATSLPVFLKPNAGMPNPETGSYTLSPEDFARQMRPCLENGVRAVGGCCGTTPETIALLAREFKGKKPASQWHAVKSLLSSSTFVLNIEGVHPLGERINPTGNKRLREALQAGDLGLVQTLAVEQQGQGAHLLDVNVGAPGVDEVTMLPLAVKTVQAVTDLPLVLDSANPKALEAALRVYNGKPLVNSTSGEQEKLNIILPLCRRYGAAVVGLTLDEEGIPDEAEQRLEIAKRILEAALCAGLPRQDVYIDTLVLAVSAGEQAPCETLRAVRLVKKELGLKTLLGVSNVSFGLPNRPLVNQTFLNQALWQGLDLPILNPGSEGMMDTLSAFRLLAGKDPGARDYLARFSKKQDTAARTQPAAHRNMTLSAAIETGLKPEAAAAARRLLDAGQDALTIIREQLVPALDSVGAGFEKGTLFLPQLLAAANSAQAAFEEVRRIYPPDPKAANTIVVATVQGDIHDIGKNIARVLLENYGFRVVDLGRDVPPERVVEAVRTSGARLVGLSALMTTTLPAMERTITALREAGLPCRVMAGGAVLTEEYALGIGADYYVKDGMRSVEAAKETFGGK